MPISVKAKNGQYMAMTESQPDSLFKLRLPGQMRDKLEMEAAKHGRTLTAEILIRLEMSFSELSERINNLEKLVYDGQKGNEILLQAIQDQKEYIEEVERISNSEIEDIQRSLSGMWRMMK